MVYISGSQTFMSRRLLKFNWRILNISWHLGYAITAKLPSEGLCSWPPENSSVALNGGRGLGLRNPCLCNCHCLSSNIAEFRLHR